MSDEERVTALMTVATLGCGMYHAPDELRRKVFAVRLLLDKQQRCNVLKTNVERAVANVSPSVSDRQNLLSLTAIRHATTVYAAVINVTNWLRIGDPALFAAAQNTEKKCTECNCENCNNKELEAAARESDKNWCNTLAPDLIEQLFPEKRRRIDEPVAEVPDE